MKNIYKQILDRINEYKTVTIFTHVQPDGDTIGTSIALKELILLNTEGIEVKISGDKYPYNLSYLPTNDEVSDDYIKNSLAILVDASSIKRTFDKRILTAKEIIKIDHHHPEGDEWSIAIEGDHYPAAGEIIFEMIRDLELKFNKTVLQALFVSIWTDTSGLVERKPTKQTFAAVDWLIENGINKEEEIKKMDISEEDKKTIRDILDTAKVENNIALIINEKPIHNDIYRTATEKFFKENEAEVYVFATRTELPGFRVGLRSKGYDVSKVAEQFNGGGHVTSSGAKAEDEETINKMIEIIKGDLNANN